MISEPEVTVTERTSEDECLILASDGLWDVVSNDTACGVVRMCLRVQKPPSPPGSPGSDMAAVCSAARGRMEYRALVLLLLAYRTCGEAERLGAVRMTSVRARWAFLGVSILRHPV